MGKSVVVRGGERERGRRRRAGGRGDGGGRRGRGQSLKSLLRAGVKKVAMDDVAGRIKQGQVRRGGRLFLLVIPRHAA